MLWPRASLLSWSIGFHQAGYLYYITVRFIRFLNNSPDWPDIELLQFSVGWEENDSIVPLSIPKYYCLKHNMSSAIDRACYSSASFYCTYRKDSTVRTLSMDKTTGPTDPPHKKKKRLVITTLPTEKGRTPVPVSRWLLSPLLSLFILDIIIPLHCILSDRGSLVYHKWWSSSSSCVCFW